MKILAGIVLFNPDITRLQENIKGIYNQVDQVVFIDNQSKNIEEIENDIISKLENGFLIKNNENYGIATALSQIMDFAINNEYDWVITLDQDSVCRPYLVQEYEKYFNIPNIGILTCKITDRNFTVNEEFANKEYKEVDKCITAASCINIQAYKKCDGFDKKMFIDGVDFDICYNMKAYGYKTIRVNYDGLLQEVGSGRNVKLFGRDYIIYNHSPFRCYYIARNNIYLARKYKDVSLAHMLKKEMIAEIATVAFEEKKCKKLIRRWKGLIDSIKMKVNPVEDDVCH